MYNLKKKYDVYLASPIAFFQIVSIDSNSCIIGKM